MVQYLGANLVVTKNNVYCLNAIFSKHIGGNLATMVQAQFRIDQLSLLRDYLNDHMYDIIPEQDSVERIPLVKIIPFKSLKQFMKNTASLYLYIHPTNDSAFIQISAPDVKKNSHVYKHFSPRNESQLLSELIANVEYFSDLLSRS